MWESLRSRFSVSNGVRKQVLKDEIAGCKQNGQSVLEYYGRLSKLWKELQNYKNGCDCTCAAATGIAQEREEDRIHQFLFGLDLPRFSNIRSTITGEDPKPPLTQVYSQVIREEQNLNVVQSKELVQTEAVGFNVKTEVPAHAAAVTGPRFRDRASLSCTHCRRQGHEASECFQLHGFPEWYFDNKGGTRPDNRDTSNRLFSEEDVQQGVLVAVEVGPTMLASYTGASHHMTGDISLLVDVFDIIPSPVTKPDGRPSRATKCVLKLLKQTGSIGTFTDTLCFLHDRFSRTLTGTGEEREGVYYFTGVLAARSHKALATLEASSGLWHRRLGHPSPGVLVSLTECVDSPRNIEFGKSIKSFRTDNGTEFMCLSSYFQEHGILHKTSCVETPQHNGQVECKHRHILNVARACLFQSHMPVKFWGESILTATHLINCTPSSVLQNKTLYEVLFGHRPSYDMIHTFGCLCYAHHHSRDKDKFGPRSQKCVFIGYPYGKKGLHLFDLDTKKIFISRDVWFQEEIFPFLHHSSSPPPPSSPQLVVVDDD
ncbi:PREDICTED: uncharacterized protein LOC104733516 [Camelina sativa]|uniref:Uncharacterized protein LOC104733516 n=1 Tax=Camelina sativa TaxID=90675 RepID=A0ABM0V638_CAMSA|nr:PREDICTED: uncharacterized protein LOC104733516 [Camelina sativa]